MGTLSRTSRNRLCISIERSKYMCNKICIKTETFFLWKPNHRDTLLKVALWTCFTDMRRWYRGKKQYLLVITPAKTYTVISYSVTYSQNVKSGHWLRVPIRLRLASDASAGDCWETAAGSFRRDCFKGLLSWYRCTLFLALFEEPPGLRYSLSPC